MNDVLTMEEIVARYPDEWVLINNPVTDQYRVLRGQVVHHSPDRDEVYAKALELPTPRYIAVRFTGKLKPGTILML